MKRPLLAAVLLLAAAAMAQPVAPHDKVRIILVGDSTMAPRSGWGDAFCSTFAPDTACFNKARGGRSTKSYREDGSWAGIMQMLAGKTGYSATYVLIQFGHNDQPGKPGRSTDLATEFPANLKRYIAEVREVGAKTVLVTSLTRRQFGPDGKIKDGLQPWADSTIKVASDEHVPLLDLHADSLAAVNKMGQEEANTLAMAPPPADLPLGANAPPAPTAPPATPGAPPNPAPPSFDYTHVGKKGAELFAAMIARELAQAVPDLRSSLRTSN